MFFVDAAHFVFGTFLCCLWSFVRIFVRAASGRQRFNVLGAWNAVTRELTYVANTTVVNTDTMCELLRKIAAQNLVGPITLVLDNARYQRNAVVQALAEELKISLLFLPYATFADFRAAIEEQLAQLSTTHRSSLASLMTHNFQQFSDVSLLAA
ncbi:MAG: transposase [Planctomycetes bacterium]|nr:transposase [Planctomycetota bacterium]